MGINHSDGLRHLLSVRGANTFTWVIAFVTYLWNNILLYYVVVPIFISNKSKNVACYSCVKLTTLQINTMSITFLFVYIIGDKMPLSSAILSAVLKMIRPRTYLQITPLLRFIRVFPPFRTAR